MEHKADKGHEGGSCNREACQAPGAIFYNHGSLSFYCSACAQMLSNDSFNRKEAQQLYGHALCTIPVEHSYGRVVAASRFDQGAIDDYAEFEMRLAEFKQVDRKYYESDDRNSDLNLKILDLLVVEWAYIRAYADKHGHALLKPWMFLANAKITMRKVNG